MKIKNVFLRVLFIPIAILIWMVYTAIHCIMGMIGFFFGLMGLASCLFFNDKLEKDMIFVLMIGWWAYYPWLWWYRYFKHGNIGLLGEFNENNNYYDI